MAQRPGTDFLQEILFDAAPLSNVTWGLLDHVGVLVTSGSVDPAGALSATLLAPSAYNMLSLGALFETRELYWSYLTAAGMVSDSVRYSIEITPPFGASKTGVRRVLGLLPYEITDDEIDLLQAYAQFQGMVGAAQLALRVGNTGIIGLAIKAAIEAQAALALLPALQFRTVKQETSGSNTFERGDIDYMLLGNYLQTLIERGRSLAVADDLGYSGLAFQVTLPDEQFPGG